jgi:hypothetical protein
LLSSDPVDLDQAFETNPHHAKGGPGAAINRVVPKNRRLLPHQDGGKAFAFIR